MKYFKKELWAAYNSGGDYKNAHEEWMKNLEEYTTQLKTLESKLSKRNFNFFRKESLHDGKIVSINIKDTQAERVKQRKPHKNIYNPLAVEIQVIIMKRINYIF